MPPVTVGAAHTGKALRPAATFEISFYHFSHDPPGEPIIRDF